MGNAILSPPSRPQAVAGATTNATVDASVVPTDWMPLRVVVKGRTIQVYVGAVTSPTLEVRKLGQQDRGMIGLWTGNNSDGDFANLRITPMK